MFKLLATGWVGLALICATASTAEAPPGFLEGHLKIFALKEVELAEAEQTKTTGFENYSEYPLVVLSGDGKREIARVTADANGNYRVALPPGDYVLDVKRRRRGGVRAKPRPFAVVSDQTVCVDMDIDTGIR